MLRYVLATVLALLVLVPTGLYAWTRVDPHTIHTEIEIDASPEEVWAVLTDFSAYPEWNPFIVSASGELREGAELTNELSRDGSTTTITPTLLVVEPGRELRWSGRLWGGVLVDGEHHFRIEPVGEDRSRLLHGETFTGALVPFAGDAIDVAEEFEAMNTALKDRVETVGA